MAYLEPVDAWVSSDWADHCDRDPRSLEPGTDYACGEGSDLVSPERGRVADLKDDTSGGTGRYLTIDLDDGRRVRLLHLSEILVGWNAPVHRGQLVARSGRSAWGSETGAGAHVHVTLIPSHSDDFENSIDFQLHVGGPALLAGFGVGGPEEDDMPKYVQVKDDRGNFAIVGHDGVGRVLSGAALRGAQKIGRVANGGSVDDASALPEVELSGEEWDSSTLAAFGYSNVLHRQTAPLPGTDVIPDNSLGPGLGPINAAID